VGGRKEEIRPIIHHANPLIPHTWILRNLLLLAFRRVNVAFPTSCSNFCTTTSLPDWFAIIVIVIIILVEVILVLIFKIFIIILV
jgi:hypothetical protein